MLIDSHFHLTDEKFKNIEKQIIENSMAEGISKLITVGTSIKDNDEVIELIKKFPNLYGSVGIYPHENTTLGLEKIEEEFKKQIKNEKIVGIGECGIDIGNYVSPRKLEDQIDLFEMQIKASIENKLPLIIHNRNGDKEVINSLEKYKDENVFGVAHCYVSTWETAKKLLDLNFYISFSGIITYPSGKEILETVKNVPEDRFLVETDAPYLAPQGHRGEVNIPKYVRITAQKVAEVRNQKIEIIEEQSYQNTSKLFGLEN